MQNAGLDEAQAGIKIAGRNISNLRYADDTMLMAESEEGLKTFMMMVKDENEKAGLKFNIQNTKIMAAGPIILGQTDGEKVKPGANFIFLGSKITAHDDCSHEIKKRLLLGRKAMIKSYDRQHIEKQRQYFANTRSSSQSYGFSSSQVWM